MKKSGLIIGGIGVIFSLAFTLASPFFLPCITPILGIAAGYMAGVFEPYSLRKAAVRSGAKAAAIGGVGMLLGQVFGALVNGFAVGPEKAAMVLNSWGMPVGGPVQFSGIYWTSLIVSTACIALFNIVLMAGLGALSGYIWWEVSDRKKEEQNPSGDGDQL